MHAVFHVCLYFTQEMIGGIDVALSEAGTSNRRHAGEHLACAPGQFCDRARARDLAADLRARDDRISQLEMRAQDLMGELASANERVDSVLGQAAQVRTAPPQVASCVHACVVSTSY